MTTPTWKTLSLIVLVPTLLAGALSFADEVAQKIGWHQGDEFVAATDFANAENRPVLAYFTASWCGPCKMMKKDTWVDDSVVAASAAYVPVMIDIDDHQDLAGRYEVNAIPTTILFSPGGEVLARETGFRDAQAVTKMLKQHAGK